MLYLPLLGQKLKNKNDVDWNLLDRQLQEVIYLTMSRSMVHNIIKYRTTMDLMSAIVGIYENPYANNKVHLMKKLFNLKM